MSFSEYIDGYTLHDFLDDEDDKDSITCLFLQVIISLIIAHDKYGYKHNDLHFANILVEKNKGCDLKYTLRGKTFNIKCKYVAKIIDYGLSTVDKFSLKPQSPHFDEDKNDLTSMQRFIEDMSFRNSSTMAKFVQKLFATHEYAHEMADDILNYFK